MFQIHSDPKDYARHTDTWYNKNLVDISFMDIFIEKQVF